MPLIWNGINMKWEFSRLKSSFLPSHCLIWWYIHMIYLQLFWYTINFSHRVEGYIINELDVHSAIGKSKYLSILKNVSLYHVNVSIWVGKKSVLQPLALVERKSTNFKVMSIISSTVEFLCKICISESPIFLGTKNC